jgi:hypothetical protein
MPTIGPKYKWKLELLVVSSAKMVAPGGYHAAYGKMSGLIITSTPVKLENERFGIAQLLLSTHQEWIEYKQSKARGHATGLSGARI